MKSPLSAQLEAVLFWKAEPLTIKKLVALLSVSEEEIKKAAEELRTALKQRGISLIEWQDELSLSTSKEVSDLIENLTKEELNKDLGKAGLETLSIILYQGPISRADIDYIRGVNSQFIVRNLLMRGLIERIDNPTDQRSFLYKGTIELISHLGITDVGQLPDFEVVKRDIENFKSTHHEEGAQN
ncbi:MAG: SMC-Scp complex subunit ScpB [Patescibacteria group bacterium]